MLVGAALTVNAPLPAAGEPPPTTYHEKLLRRLRRAEARASEARARASAGLPAVSTESIARESAEHDRLAPARVAAAGEGGRWEEWAPPSRNAHALLRDSRRDRVLVVGGDWYGGTAVWAHALDGTQGWTTIEDGGSLPPDVTWMSAVYDSTADRIVACVGRGAPFGPAMPLEVWTLPLSGYPLWSPLAAAGVPPSRTHASLAIDEPGARMFLYEGIGEHDDTLRVWTLSLGADPVWSRLDAEDAPARTGYGQRRGADYDRARNRLVVAHGLELWAIDLTGAPRWSLLGEVQSYDPPQQVLVEPATGEIWAVAGDLSVSAFSSGAPHAALRLDGFGSDSRGAIAAALDPARRRIMVHGGWGPLIWHTYSDLLAYPLDGSDGWSRIAPVSGGPRMGHMALVDPVRDRLVLYGGATPWYSPRFGPWDTLFTRRLGDPGGGAEPLVPAPGPRPPAHRSGVFLYDPVRDRAVVFGGHEAQSFGSFEEVNQTWVLPLGEEVPAWSRLEPAGAGPGHAFVKAGCYDPIRDRVLAFGSTGGAARAWSLALAPAPAWRELPIRVIGAMGTGFEPTALYFDPLTGGFWGWEWSSARVMRITADGESLLVETRDAAAEPAEYWRFDARMFDPLRRRLIVSEEDFSSRDVLDGFWSINVDGPPEWTWHESARAPRRDRYDYAWAYDPSRDRLVIHGGYDDNDHYFDDWWALGFDRPTPVLAALVSAGLDGRIAKLAWHVTGGASRIGIERARQGGAWVEIAEAFPDGDGMVRFEDASLAAGERAGYRLRATDEAGQRTLGEAWLDVPAGAAFALHGAIANPVVSDLDVAFSLDRAGAATVELLDLQGRRVVARSVVATEGPQRVRLASRSEVAPGVYFVRLRTERRALTARVAVLR
jgi:hypothetical protein